MKATNFILFILLTLSLAGCRFEDSFPVPDNGDGSLRFIIDKPERPFTRGLPLNTADSLNSITVYGYYTGNGTDNWSAKYSDAVPNFMDGTTLTNTGYGTSTANWTYSPTLYWPSFTNSNVSFYAYYPQPTETNGLTLTSTTGGLTFKYTAPETCVDQPDLMIATPVFDKNSGTVNLDLNHALVCIGFSAIGSYDVVETIEVANIVVSGTVSITGTASTFTWDLDDPVSTVYRVIPNGTVIDNTTQSIMQSNGYLLVPPQTLGENAIITVTTKYGVTKSYNMDNSVWEAGKNINYILDLKASNTDITDTVAFNYFVGAFWRYNETTERIIRMDNTGYWEAFVLCTDSQWDEEDIMVDGLAEGNPTKQGVAISGDPLQMIDTQTYVYGSGDISFRLGLTTSTVLDSANAKPRYAFVLLRYDNYTKNHLIYLRQGEAADSIIGSTRFAPYNIGTAAYEFIDYPSKVGGYKQWSTDTDIYIASGDGGPTTVDTDTIANVCPNGYRVPTADEFKALIYDTYYGYSGGLYADGYFDRQTITYTTNTSNGFTYPSVGSGADLAYAGIICYNTNNYSSAFFPFAGCLPAANPITNSQPGEQGYYWTTNLATYSSDDLRPNYFNPVYKDTISVPKCVSVTVGVWCERTDACTIRPVAVNYINSPDDTEGTLDGYTNDSGWE